MLEQLRLDGREVELKQLYREVSQLFGQKKAKIPDDIPDGVMLRFAAKDAVRVQFRDGAITVFLALDRLAYEKNQWRQFVVRAVYRPSADGIDATFKRDGYIRLKGRRLKLRDQVVLRGIFSAVFARNTPVHLLGEELPRDDRFQNLRVSQYAVHAGWLGLALSPKRDSSDHPRTARTSDRRTVESFAR